MSNKKSLYIYYFLAIIMSFIPLVNMLAFVPFVMVYKKYDYKKYITISFFISLLSILTFRSFSSIIAFVISYIIINQMKKNRKGYEILFICSVIAGFLMILDFTIIKLDSKSYMNLLESVNNNFSNMGINSESLNLKKTIENLSNFYPSVVFFISYTLSSVGYLFLYKRAYNLENKKENIVTPISYKVIFVIVIFYILINILSGNINQIVYYKLYLLYANILIILFIMLTIEGYIAFNLYLKKILNKLKTSNFLANVISFVSLFLLFSYFVYLFYASYNSIVKGVKNEKNID